MPHSTTPCAAIALLALSALAPPASPASTGNELRTLTPSQMEQDLFRLTEALEAEHAGLLRYTSREELDAAYGDALQAMEEERTILEFYRIIASIVARVRCGHTRLAMSAVDRDAILSREGVLPFEVQLRGGRAWISRRLAESVPLAPGTELRSIDGRTIAEIRALAFDRMSGDGFIETGKERELERDFGTRYALLVDEGEGSGSFRVETADATIVTVAGLAPEVYRSVRSSGPDRPPLRLELLADDDVGILSVGEFEDRGGTRFPDLLRESFRELESRHVGHLVLDLRGNGGGVDEYGALLVSYLSAEPFGYFERIEVAAGYELPGYEVVEEGGRRLMKTHSGLDVQQPSEHRFGGQVFVLTDGWTFSTAADVATVLYVNGLATFVGEETGGGCDGNTSGDSVGVTLECSGLTVRIPRWMYTTANADRARSGRGVPPDHPVQPSIEDVLAGRDAALELVLGWIREGEE